MAKPTEIKAAMERVESILAERPAKAMMTKSVTAESINGLQCTISDGEFTITADMPEVIGGENTAMTPGNIALSALAACLNIGYAMVFAKQGIAIDKLSVEGQADFDQRAAVAVPGVETGFLGVRYCIDLESAAERADILAALDDNDALSPVLQSFIKPVPVAREVYINQAQEAAK